MKLRLVPVVFLALATLDAVGAVRAIGAFSAQGGGRLALLALHAVLQTAVALAFAFFTAQRPEPRGYARAPVAFLACAVAMLAVVPVSGPSRGTPSTLLLGDAVAVGGTVWIFASVLALGRCFGVLPEARGLVTHGPYHLVRHPVYLGEIGAMAGLTLAAPAPAHLIALAIFVLAQLVRMGLEEKALSEAFPEYAAYAARTPRLIPAPRVAVGLVIAATATLALVAPLASARRHRAPVRHRHRAVVIAGLREPALQSPANDASVQSLPTFEWAPVAHAASYQFELAADSRFGSLVQRTLSGQGSLQTYNTAATLDKTLPDGAYWWRVRALTAKGSAGAWSPVRRIVKAWSAAPQITGGDGAAVSWPTTPLVLRWSSVPYATKYIVSIATDPALSNLVLGSATQPLETQGTSFAMPVSLASGAYYWAVTPLDAEGHRGVRSRVASFQWSWPTTTATSLTDLNREAGIFDDPMFSWSPVPGAARYEVEVNSDEHFAAGSRWCCEGTTTGTSLSPLVVLANNRYYWRVRAFDARGDAGVWNEGQSFEKAFDPTTPTIRELTVRNAEGQAQSGVPKTDTPIVTWDPVKGASRYEVQLGLYKSGLGCDFSNSPTASDLHASTATTAWTPIAWNGAGKQGPSEWPTPQSTTDLPAGGTTYCVRVLARTDEDAQHHQVISAWTQINGANQPAFTFLDPPPPGSPGSEGLNTPANAYLLPKPDPVQPGCDNKLEEPPHELAKCTLTPLLTWKRVAGAQGYFVVIAHDARFTEVADVGFTDVPAYAPRLANQAPLSDQTTDYYWAVIPTGQADGHGVYSFPCFTTVTNPCESANDNPQRFDKSSTPPTPITLTAGAEVSTQPTFEWSSAENARNYQLEVSQDPTFGKPIDDVTTDATAYTSSSTYPADTVVYWRVRANDWNGQGLNWSRCPNAQNPEHWCEFVRRLPVPSPAPGSATSGQEIPPLSWTPVQGAISYDLHLEEPNGTKKDFTSEAPSATVVKYYGTGIWRWQVRAEFPAGSGGKVAGGYSAPLSSLLTLPAPGGARGVKTGTRLVVSWNPDPAAKQYEVDVSTTDGFLTTVDSHRTDNTSWAPNVDLTTAANRGRLFWRVAAIDQGGNVGAFATGSFGKPRPAPKPRCTNTGHKLKGHKPASKCSSHKPKRKRGRR